MKKGFHFFAQAGIAAALDFKESVCCGSSFSAEWYSILDALPALRTDTIL